MADGTVTLTGVVEELRDPQSFGQYVEFQVAVIKVPGKFPQTFPIEFVNQHMALLDGVGLGDEVRVQADVTGQRGKKNPEQIFVKLAGVNLVKTGNTVPIEAPVKAAASGDLPF